jgi:hypothetical protein
VRALEQGETARAYALMSAEYRARVSRESFEAALSQFPQEAAELGAALQKAGNSLQHEARGRLATGAEVRLLREGTRWSIAGELVDFYGQATPRAALRSFVRALRSKRYDIVLRFVPEAERAGLTPELLAQSWSGEPGQDLERLLSALERDIEGPIEQIGTHATLHYGGGLRAQLIREGEHWKVQALE